MHLLTLPDELFLMEIFPYLHSTDLIRAFATLDNARLLSLIYASIRHVDLPDEINCIEPFRHYQWNQIRSLGIHADHLHEAIYSIFPSLDYLHVRVALSSNPSCLLSLSPRLKHLRLLSDESEQPPVTNNVAQYIWHRDSRIQRLSIVDGLLMDKPYFEISSSLVCNRHLTHLSLVVADLHSSTPLLALSPTLEHLRICLRKHASNRLKRTWDFPSGQPWSSRVKSLHLTAHDMFLDTHSLCRYIKLFSLSLERVAFYAHLIQSYLMRSRRHFEENLLDHLPKLKHLHFCVLSGFGCLGDENRRSFDGWKHQRHVISMFNSRPGYHTRFTMPFVFDQLERVTNDFVDFHSNQPRPNFVLTLPSITSISFYAAVPLTLKLMTTIKHACPRLRRVAFKVTFKFHDDLIEDTQLTLPTVEHLRLCDLGAFGDRSCQRLFCLIPNLGHFIIDSGGLQQVLGAVECQYNRFDAIRQVTLLENVHGPFVDRQIMTQNFPNANVIYRHRSR